jgi:hypothetical protein
MIRIARTRFRRAGCTIVALALLASGGELLAQSVSTGDKQSVSAAGPNEAAAAATPPDYGELLAAKKVPQNYPFQVKVGGQLATVEGKPEIVAFAKLKDPVSANAEVEVVGVPAMIIINIFKANSDGTVTSSASPKIILVQNGNRTSLDATIDKSTLPPGTYIMNIVYANVTSRVFFTVK